MSSDKLFSCDFEVFGIVQGVFFRKHTQKKAIEFQCRGWCMNTPEGTVKGQMEGNVETMRKLQYWMREVGSPTSRVDKAIFSTLKPIDDFTNHSFEIRK